jgi:hypothetical protein
MRVKHESTYVEDEYSTLPTSPESVTSLFLAREVEMPVVRALGQEAEGAAAQSGRARETTKGI